MKILVTGSNGFIGKHLMKQLDLDGHGVIQELFGLPNLKEIDAVIHLAGKAGIRPDLQGPIEHYQSNVMDTVALLEQCARDKVKSFVFISSSAVYGNGKSFIQSEDDSTDQPLCHYAATKKAGELACYTYHKMYGMDMAILRLFTVYGPGQKTEMAIPLFTRLISEGLKVPIFSPPYNGRDYVYVDDVVSAIVKAVEMNRGFNIFNIGSGHLTPIGDLVKTISTILGKEAKVSVMPQENGYANCTCANIEKARLQLGYEPRVNLYRGLKRYVEWYLAKEE